MARLLCDDDFRSRIEHAEIRGIGTNDAMPTPSGAKHDRGINDVARSPHAAELTRFACSFIIEWFDVDIGGTEQPRESRLFAPVTPDLAYHPGGHRQIKSVLEGAKDEPHYPPLIALERDQRTRVQGQARHQGFPPRRFD